ncbi:MAG: hypothetical protein DSZ05_08895 [Sulfurospirillum sp.]|nr:MAG: hypothetical protein DSZ05_08895 [Sulfurospirillum sp.]
MIQKLMEPSVALMNKIPFKTKIVATISILFVLLILPSHNMLHDYFEQSNRLEKQSTGLLYTQKLQDIIRLLQLHRGLSNSYYRGTKNLKQKIITIEKELKQKITALLKFDREHLNILKQNKNFIDAMSTMALIELQHIRQNITTDALFKLHSEIIDLLIKSLGLHVKETSFLGENAHQINTIADLLSDKLLYLQEYTAQLRGIVAGLFTQKHLSKQQKKIVLEKYTLINAFKTNLNSTLIPRNIPYYLKIEQQSKLAAYKLDDILDIVNQHILLHNSDSTLSYNSQGFFKQSTKALEEQIKLYNLLLESYHDLVSRHKQQIQNDFLYMLAGFAMIIFASLYLFGAFYHSINRNLTQLKNASVNMLEGNMDTKLEIQTKDEIGDALLAFDKMRQELRKNISFLNSYKMAIDESSIVSKTDTKGIITYVNKKFCELSGYSEKELIGKPHNIVRHSDMPKETFAALWSSIKQKKIWKGVIKNCTKEGKEYIVDATIIPLLGEESQIIGYVGVRHDITELERSKEEIKKQKIDFLTQLPNRNQLQEDLSAMQSPVLFYLNIDNFADLNDFYGTDTGDNVLIFIASLFHKISAQSDLNCYKLQGDEFALLIDQAAHPEQDYIALCHQLIHHLETSTVDCDNKECVSITFSGGIAFHQDDDVHPLNLLTYAAIARKMAKHENKKFLTYDKSMRNEQNYENNIKWIQKIKKALHEDRIVAFFQPIVSNKTGEIGKYEALVRLIEEDGKIVSPFFFLDIAKKAKLYEQISRTVIDKTFAAFANVPCDFSLNLTIEDLKNPEVINYIYQKLRTSPHAKRAIFEITESEEVHDYETINQFVENVQQYGTRVAIDDFGSGYANFEHILEIDADIIKIDGSLIKNIHQDKKAYIITEAIINFAQKLGKETVVEFVHNEEVLQTVKKLGADYSQGFHLGEPSSQILSETEVLAH